VKTKYTPTQLFQSYCQQPATMHSTQWKYQISAQIQYVLNFFPLLNAQSIPLPITLPSSLPKAVPSLKHTFFSRQVCMHCLLNFTTVFPAAWCALVFLNSSPFWTVSFYPVYKWAQCFWFALQTASFCHGCWRAHCFSFALPYKQLHFATAAGVHTVSHLLFLTNNFILPWLLACTLFLIRSSLQTASFYHVYQETTVFLTFFPLPMNSLCHDYQQASMFLIFFPNEQLQLVVFTGRPRQCGTSECSQIPFQFWKSYFLVTVDLCAC
jgi:hypothetical protein